MLHTIGSHGPTYYNRYPAQFKQFTPTCDTNEIQSCTQQQLTNTYDNTILYVDYVVDKAIKLLQSKQDKFTTSFGVSLGSRRVAWRGWGVFTRATVVHRPGDAKTRPDAAVAVSGLSTALWRVQPVFAAKSENASVFAG